MSNHLIVICFCIGLLAGCSNIKRYESNLPENLYLKAKTDSDVTATVDIYTVDKKCKLTYQGAINIENKISKVGIPVDKPSYLTISFSKSSFWSGQSSNISQEAMIWAKKGYRYQMDLSYEDAIYDIELISIHRKSGKSREMELESIASCGK